MIESSAAERLYLRLEGDPLYAPETSVPVGAMSELPVAEGLRAHVAHVAACREVFPDGTEVHERVLPDGAVRILFNLGDPVSPGACEGPSASVVGASAWA